jgi:hypothetical protein
VLKDIDYVQLEVDDYLESIDYAGGWTYW